MRLLLTAILLLATSVAGNAVSAQTLDRVYETGVFKIGYRTDAMPFSYRNARGEPAGYSVELCNVLAEKMTTIPELAKMRVEYVPVSTEDRFDAIKEHRIDILCGATTATLSRRQYVDFSVPIFITGASVLTRIDGPEGFEGLAGKKIGVRAATTTERSLRATLKQTNLSAEVVPVASHDEGLAKVMDGSVSAYFGDRAILLFMMARSTAPEQLRVSNRFLSYEPYALAMQRGDSDFRLIVDTLISRIYRTAAIESIVKASFGQADMGDLVRAMFLIVTLPE